MSTIWWNGRKYDKEKYIKELELSIQEHQAEIVFLQRVDTFINEAIKEHFKKEYRPLDKLISEYGDIEGLRGVYGWGGMTQAKFEKLCDKFETLKEDRDKMEETIKSLDLSRYIRREIQKEKDTIVNCRLRIDEAKSEGMDE